MNEAIMYLRVSTTRQGQSGLGIDSQREMCRKYAESKGWHISAEFKDVESGKSRERQGLWGAIEYCTEHKCPLIIAKLDRMSRDVEFTFKVMNTGVDIHFTDMPFVNTMILGVFASVAQYERELISKRTRDALSSKKKRGERTGGTNEDWGKNTGADRAKAIQKAVGKAALLKTERARAKPCNKEFKIFIEHWEALHGKISKATDWAAVADKLNSEGRRTSTGLPYNSARAAATYKTVKKLYEL